MESNKKKCSVDRLDAGVRNCNFFYGKISREDAEMILKQRGATSGLYLLRLGYDATYILSMWSNGTMFNFKVERSSNGRYYLDREEGRGPEFRSVLEVVYYHRTQRHFTHRPVIECTRGDDPISLYYGVVEPQVARWLQGSKAAASAGTKLDDLLSISVGLFEKSKTKKAVESVLRSQQTNQPWYFPNYCRERAEMKICSYAEREGRFLVRCDSGEHSHKLSVFSGGRIEHYKIAFVKAKYQITSANASVRLDFCPRFRTLIELVDFYHMKASAGVPKLIRACVRTVYQFEYPLPYIYEASLDFRPDNRAAASTEQVYSMPDLVRSLESATYEVLQCPRRMRDLPGNSNGFATATRLRPETQHAGSSTSTSASTSSAANASSPQVGKKIQRCKSQRSDGSDLASSSGFSSSASNAMPLSTLQRSTSLTSASGIDLTKVPFKEIRRADLRIDDNHLLGKGQFGAVYRAHWRYQGFDQPVAVKLILNSGADIQPALRSEAEIMQKIAHRSIVRALGFSENLDGALLIVMELMDKSLRNYMKVALKKNTSQGPAISEKQITLWMCQVAEGMHYLETSNIIHRDLAARNLLLNARLECKISDFGLSRMLKNSTYYRCEQEEIPFKWCAIEVLVSGKASSKSDAWSFGVCMWEAFSFCCSSPYRNEETELNIKIREVESMVMLLSRGLRLKQPEHCPNEVYQLMSCCWQANPNDRPNFSQIALQLRVIHEKMLNEASKVYRNFLEFH